MHEPTAEDRARDLAADLRSATRPIQTITYPAALALSGSIIAYAMDAVDGWPAAIRRALAAEAWKAWVHGWLDAAGVPPDPDPEHTAATGCRISGRLRWLLGRATTAEAQVAQLKAEVARLQALLAGEPAQPPTPQYPIVPDWRE